MRRGPAAGRTVAWLAAALWALALHPPSHHLGATGRTLRPPPQAPLPPPTVLPQVQPPPSRGRCGVAELPLPPAAVLPRIPFVYDPAAAAAGATGTAAPPADGGDDRRAAAAPAPEPLRLPPPVGLPPVPVPDDNPLTAVKVELGEALFFDPGLSTERTLSCASCHRPGRYFADGKPLSTGFAGQAGERNAPTLLNAAYAPQLLWDGRAFSLEEQVLYPVTHPLEMNTTPEMVVAHVVATEPYPAMFRTAFGSEEITFERISQAIASFERTLLAGGSPFDLFIAGDRSALSGAARRGWDLFRGKAACIQCHDFAASRPFFTDFEHYNTGVAWQADAWTDLGRFEITKAREDKGAFRTPTLRNVAETAPYMHDGSLGSLAEVIDFYRRGGNDNPNLDAKLRPIELTASEAADLIAFLEALTGEVTYDPADRQTSLPGR